MSAQSRSGPSHDEKAREPMAKWTSSGGLDGAKVDIRVESGHPEGVLMVNVDIGVLKPGRGCKIHVHFRALRGGKCPPSGVRGGVYRSLMSTLRTQGLTSGPRIDILASRLDILPLGGTSSHQRVDISGSKGKTSRVHPCSANGACNVHLHGRGGWSIRARATRRAANARP